VLVARQGGAVDGVDDLVLEVERVEALDNRGTPINRAREADDPDRWSCVQRNRLCPCLQRALGEAVPSSRSAARDAEERATCEWTENYYSHPRPPLLSRAPLMAGRLRPRLRVLHRRLLVALAHDATAETATRSALVLAPHPDDETIGCGGSILLKTTAGTPVRVVVAADGGNEERRAECREACRHLGVPPNDVVFLGFVDGSLAPESVELCEKLGDLLHDFAPDEIYAPSAVDAHSDHQALATSVVQLQAAGLAPRAVLRYPIWFWNRWAWVDRATPRWRQQLQLFARPILHLVNNRMLVVRIDDQSAQKRLALAAHASQVEELPGAPDRRTLDPQWLKLFMGNDELFFMARRSRRHPGRVGTRT
jgi:LmbE family N-acetylglucosaminyl deacetylase